MKPKPPTPRVHSHNECEESSVCPQHKTEDKVIVLSMLDFTGVNMRDHNEAQCNEDTLGAHEQTKEDDK